jgi:predicted DNA-binding transcriptional regulator AlpA
MAKLEIGLLSIKDLASTLGVSVRTLYEMRKLRTFPKPLREFSRPTWSQEQIERWLRTQQSK